MKILIIDDHEIMAEGIIKRVKKVLPEATCLFADNIRYAYALLSQHNISLIISDLEFDNEEELDGFFIAEKVLELEPRTKLIALTHYNSYKIMRKAKSVGFHSFLNKGSSFKDFSDTINNVLKQGHYQSETEKLLIKKRKAIAKTIFNDSLKGLSLLTKREIELTLLSAQTTDRNKLAKEMNIDPFTVDSHYKNILSKLNLMGRKELAIFAYDFKDELEKKLWK